MANVLKFVSCNVHGISDYQRREKVISQLVYPKTSSPPHVVFLQDTRLTKKHKASVSANFSSYHCYQSFCTLGKGAPKDKPTEQIKSNACSGILTAIHKGLDPTILKVINSHEFNIIHCKILEEYYVLVNVHFKYYSSAAKDNFVAALQKMWSEATKLNTAKIIIGGDFNQVLDEKLDTLSGREREGYTELFQQFVEEAGLSDVWRALNPDKTRYTFFANRYSKPQGTRIDRFLVSDLAFNYCWHADIGYKSISDHSPIYLDVLINRNVKGKGLFRFPSWLCSDSQFRELLAADIVTFKEVNINRVPTSERANPGILWDTLKAVICGYAIKYACRQNREKNATLQKLEKEVYDLTELRDACPMSSERFDKLDKQLQAAETEREKAFERKCTFDRISGSNTKNKHADVSSAYFFHKVRGIPGALRFMIDEKNNDTLNSDEEILDHCRTFYENVYTNFMPKSFRISNFTWVPHSSR